MNRSDSVQVRLFISHLLAFLCDNTVNDVAKRLQKPLFQALFSNSDQNLGLPERQEILQNILTRDEVQQYFVDNVVGRLTLPAVRRALGNDSIRRSIAAHIGNISLNATRRLTAPKTAEELCFVLTKQDTNWSYRKKEIQTQVLSSVVVGGLPALVIGGMAKAGGAAAVAIAPPVLAVLGLIGGIHYLRGSGASRFAKQSTMAASPVLYLAAEGAEGLANLFNVPARVRQLSGHMEPGIIENTRNMLNTMFTMGGRHLVQVPQDQSTDEKKDDNDGDDDDDTSESSKANAKESPENLEKARAARLRWLDNQATMKRKKRTDEMPAEKAQRKFAASYIENEIKTQKAKTDNLIHKLVGRDITTMLNASQLTQLTDWFGACFQQLSDDSTGVDVNTKFSQKVAANRSNRLKCMRRVEIIKNGVHHAVFHLFLSHELVRQFFFEDKMVNQALQSQLIDNSKVGRAVLTLDTQPGMLRLIGLGDKGNKLDLMIPAEDLCSNIEQAEKCNIMDVMFKVHGVQLILNDGWAKHFKVPTQLAQIVNKAIQNKRKKSAYIKSRARAYAQLAKVMQDQGILDITLDIPQYIDTSRVGSTTFNKDMAKVIKRINAVKSEDEKLELHDNVSQLFITEHITDDFDFHKEFFVNQTQRSDSAFMECVKYMGLGKDIAPFAQASINLVEDLKKAQGKLVKELFKKDLPEVDQVEFTRVCTFMVRPILLCFILPSKDRKKNTLHIMIGDMWYMFSLLRLFREVALPHLVLEIHELTVMLNEALAKNQLEPDVFRDVLYSRYWADLFLS